ncbi:MAG: oxidoreductase [Polyangiales bacterium]
MHWTTNDIPRLDGKTILITGANSGLGLETARALARHGPRLILACRSREKAQQASTEILSHQPDAQLEPLALDLSDLASVRHAAREVAARHDRLDVLINNAGVMATPYMRTKDGYELQFGTNHLGHFALTGLLFALLRATPRSRVVSVSSEAHKLGQMRFDDPHWEKGYSRWPAYGTSKLANLLFTNELARRTKRAGIDVTAAAAHPGYANTNLQLRPLQMTDARWAEAAVKVLNPLFGQSAAMGALPQLYAATAPDVEGGDYVGPGGMFGTRGYPRKVRARSTAYDTAAMEKLWDMSESMTRAHFGL